MSTDSTQPFNINEDTAQPSHRPKHDEARRDVDEHVDDEGTTITPSDTADTDS